MALIGRELLQDASPVEVDTVIIDRQRGGSD